MIPAPRNALVSYHYYAKDDLEKYANLRLIGDSGAFSALSQGATIPLDDLCAWAIRWKHRLAWMASLDVIGDPVGTRRNWQIMVDRYGIQAVPTIHFPHGGREMEHYIDQGVDFFGLGGLVGTGYDKAKTFRWLVSIFRYAQQRHPHVRFHGWGVTSQTLLRLPFFSVDSSAWGSGYRYGIVRIRDPRTNKNVTVAMDGKDAYTSAKAHLLARHYGVAPSQISRSHGGNAELIVRMSALSASVQEQHFRSAHGLITSPTWGINTTYAAPRVHLVGESNEGATSPVDGPHLHLVDGSKSALERLNTLAGPPGHVADSTLRRITSTTAQLAQPGS